MPVSSELHTQEPKVTDWPYSTTWGEEDPPPRKASSSEKAPSLRPPSYGVSPELRSNHHFGEPASSRP